VDVSYISMELSIFYVPLIALIWHFYLVRHITLNSHHTYIRGSKIILIVRIRDYKLFSSIEWWSSRNIHHADF